MTGWHSAHLYYYAPDKRDLLLDAVRPLMAELRPYVRSAYPVLHWRQGPHVRLNVLADEQIWTGTVRPLIDRFAGAYLRAHPSISELDERAEMPTHLLLAEREQEHGPLSPWYPDNSVQFAPYDARLHVLGGQEVADLLAGFLAAATEPLFGQLELLRSGADRELLCLGLMVAASHRLAPPIERSFMSYRSHAEGFLEHSRDPDATRAVFDEYYRRRRGPLTGQVRSVVATLQDKADEPLPYVREWADLLGQWTGSALPLIEAEVVYQKTPVAAPGTGYLATFAADRGFLERHVDTTGFRRYRLGLNWTYLQMNRLGVTPFQRMRTCFVVARAVEETYGVSVDDMVREFAARRARAGG